MCSFNVASCICYGVSSLLEAHCPCSVDLQFILQTVSKTSKVKANAMSAVNIYTLSQIY